MGSRGEKIIEIENMLFDFVKRVSKGDIYSEAEMQALPQIAQILILSLEQPR